MKKLIRNRARCLKCGEIIESKSVHDFVMCKCGNLHVDGGLEYAKRGYFEENSLVDMCEYEEGK